MIDHGLSITSDGVGLACFLFDLPAFTAGSGYPLDRIPICEAAHWFELFLNHILRFLI
jgi:hypothetical protein